jgi:hypothetical protein
MKTKKQKGGAILGLLTGLTSSAVAAAASQSGGGVPKRKMGKRDLVTESIKSGYNPGLSSFIDIMQCHRGLLHQRGQGWGAPSQNSGKSRPGCGRITRGRSSYRTRIGRIL